MSFRATMTADKTPQQVYDDMKAACEAGTFPSKNGNYNCCYRANQKPDCPKACGIGVYIPDDKYHTQMEGESPRHVLKEANISTPNWWNKQAKMNLSDNKDDIAIHTNFGGVLQCCHDFMANEWDNEKFLDYVKKQFTLNGMIVE